MNDSAPLVVFSLDDSRYGLPLHAVDRIVRAAQITSLPGAPEGVLGIINLQGRVLPVIDVRKRFGLPPRAVSAADHMVIALAKARSVALLVDSLVGISEYSDDAGVEGDDVLPDLRYVKGVVKLKGGMVVIHELDSFLSLDEERELNRALAGGS